MSRLYDGLPPLKMMAMSLANVQSPSSVTEWNLGHLLNLVMTTVMVVRNALDLRHA